MVRRRPTRRVGRRLRCSSSSDGDDNGRKESREDSVEAVEEEDWVEKECGEKVIRTKGEHCGGRKEVDARDTARGTIRLSWCG